MFDSTADIVKTAALLLAIALPAIAAIFSYRREELRSRAPATVGAAGAHAIGVGLLNESTAERFMATAHEVKDSINRLARAVELYTDDNDKRDRMMDRFCDELVACRRAIEEMAEQKGRRR